MSDTNERSVASDGSVQPVAWGVIRPDGRLACASHSRGGCQSVCFEGDEVVPLYRSQMLTGEERQAVEWASEMLDVGSLPQTIHKDMARTLRGLVERTSAAKGEFMQWIERTDREPSEDGWYLVCDMETAPYLPDRAEYESGQWSQVQGDEEFVITHWMELPPPPFEVNWDDD